MSEQSNNAFSPEEVASLETQFKRIARVSNEDGAYEYFIKPAERLQWKKFRKAANNEDDRPDAQEDLIKASVVAVKYDGRTAIGSKEARSLLEELLNDYTGATDGAKVLELVMRLNNGVGRGK